MSSPSNVNKKKLFWGLTLLASIGLSLSLSLYQATRFDASQSYGEYLQQSEQQKLMQMSSDELAAIPKQDRPDLANAQDFFLTQDPALKRPTPERLYPIMRSIQKERQQRKGIPGAQQYPWVERGPDNVGGRTRALMYDPNDPSEKKVWAGGITGGLWYNDDPKDPNSKWQNVNDFWDNIAVSAITYDPQNTQIMYLGTGESYTSAARGAGIWKSTNGGQTWNQLSNTVDFYFINDLVVRVENGNSVLYAAADGGFAGGAWHTNGSRGLMRSTNGGTSFKQVLPLVSNRAYAPSDLELGSDNRLWVATRNNPWGDGGGTIFYSDNGTNWTQSYRNPNGRRVEMVVAPSNANICYAIIEADRKVDEILKTTNKGQTWTNLPEPVSANPDDDPNDFSRKQAWYDLILGVDPNDPQVIYAGAVDLYKSPDGGQTWQQISEWAGRFGFQYVHADQHSMAFHPSNSNEMIFGNDGGVAHTANRIAAIPSITHRNQGYNVTQFYTAALHPNAGVNQFLGGTQDNGTQRFTQAGMNSTATAAGGDGAYCFIDQQNPSIQVASYQRGEYLRSVNGGISFSRFFEITDDTGFFINPTEYDDQLGILYCTGDGSSINRVLNVRTTPSPDPIALPQLAGNKASHLRASPYGTNSSTVFVGSSAGKLLKITNAESNSPTVTDISGSNFPDGSISCVEIGASDNELLVTFFNYGLTSVWYSSNGGSSWVNKEGNLPDMPVRWALFNPHNRNEVLLATQLGVWSTQNFNASSPNWIPSVSGLANVRVDMLQIRESDKEVIAATHGRGMFSSNAFFDPVLDACQDQSLPVALTVEKGLETWTQEVSDDLDWTVQQGSSLSSGTGPSAAFEGQNYLYIESSFTDVGFPQKRAILTSTCLDLSEQNAPKLSFAYHMYGFFTGSLSVEVLDQGNWKQVWTQSGDQGDQWLLAEVDLSAYAQKGSQVRFIGITGDGSKSDIAIDDIKLEYQQQATPKSLPISLTFENDIEDWTQDTDEDLDWTLKQGSTSSSDTGPSNAFEGQSYIYTESSSNVTPAGSPNKKAVFTSPLLNLSEGNTPTLSFAYHMYGSSMGDLSVEILDQGAWKEIWKASGDKGDQWLPATVNLAAYAAASTQIRFVGITGTSFRSDMALDDIALAYGTLAPNWPVTASIDDHTVFIRSDAFSLSFPGGQSLQDGDYIGAFYPDNGVLRCAGKAEWKSGNLAIAVYGDDTGTPTVKEGFSSGENFQWKVWQASSQQEFDMIASYQEPNGIITHKGQFAVNGISQLTNLIERSSLPTHTLILEPGWNQISSYLQPIPSDMESIFASIADQLVIVKNGKGEVYMPSIPINDIGNWDVSKGYELKSLSTTPLTVDIRGIKAEADRSIPLKQGWNLFAYLLDTEVAVGKATTSLTGAVELIKDHQGHVFLPSLGINSIGNMKPGQGYWAKLTANAVLNYSIQNRQGPAVAMHTPQLSPQHFVLSRSSGVNATLILHAEGALQYGDEVGVFNSEGQLVGAAVYEDHVLAFPIWGDDLSTEWIDGLQSGESFSLRVWRQASSEESTLSFDAHNSLFSENGVIEAQLLLTTRTDLLLHANRLQVYPNPASAYAAVSIELASTSQLSITIYDAHGRLLQQQAPKTYTAGSHELKFSTLDLPSGLYQCRVLVAGRMYTVPFSVVR